jgi:hypothetical protein
MFCLPAENITVRYCADRYLSFGDEDHIKPIEATIKPGKIDIVRNAA